MKIIPTETMQILGITFIFRLSDWFSTVGILLRVGMITGIKPKSQRQGS